MKLKYIVNMILQLVIKIKAFQGKKILYQITTIFSAPIRNLSDHTGLLMIARYVKIITINCSRK